MAKRSINWAFTHRFQLRVAIFVRYTIVVIVVGFSQMPFG